MIMMCADVGRLLAALPGSRAQDALPICDSAKLAFLESANGTAACHQTAKESASSSGGTPSAQPSCGVVRVYGFRDRFARVPRERRSLCRRLESCTEWKQPSLPRWLSESTQRTSPGLLPII